MAEMLLRKLLNFRVKLLSMGAETIIIVVQVIAALGGVVSVVYLGIQIHQQNESTRPNLATLLHKDSRENSLPLQKIQKFADFLAKDWSGETYPRRRVEGINVYRYGTCG